MVCDPYSGDRPRLERGRIDDDANERADQLGAHGT